MPKGLKRLIREKISFLDAIPDEFINQTVRGAQSPLFDIMVSQFIDKLETDEKGNILPSNKNFQLIAGIDKAWQQFQEREGLAIINQHLINFGIIVTNNLNYYQEVLTKNKAFVERAKNITSTINRRLGINADGSLIKAGYMGGILEDVSVRNQIKEFSIKSVANGTGFEKTKQELSKLIKGDDNLGILQKYYRNIAYDSYKQIDGLNNKLFGEQFSLKYFLYDGTIIKTSRKFCKEHCFNIYTVEQANDWINDPDLTAIPLNYDPLVDMGGYACRHTPRFVTDDMAFDLDPSLKV